MLRRTGDENLTAIQPTSGAPSDAESIADGFTAARAQARAIQAFPGVVPTDLAGAYRVQAAAIARWHDSIRGWKVARVPPSFASQYPEERLIGPAFARNVHSVRGDEAATCP